MRKRVFASFCAILAVLCACGSLWPGLHSLESEILVNICEKLDAQKGIVLLLRTSKIYPCCNYSIRGVLEVEPPRIAIELLGIEMPRICLTALGPASWDIELGELENGNYLLSFSYFDEKSLFSLSVTDSVLEIKGGDTEWIIIEKPVFRRI